MRGVSASKTNRANKLDPGLGIGRAREFDLAMLPFRKLSKGERPVVQHVRVAHPMLFVVVSLGQEPELVAAVVEPLARSRRQILACKLGIDEQIGMSGETHLHEPPAILWHHDQLHPSIGELLRVPALIVHGFDATFCTLRRIGLTARLDGGQRQADRAKKTSTARRRVRFARGRCSVMIAPFGKPLSSPEGEQYSHRAPGPRHTKRNETQ